ncbi:lisH domain-containing protein FOPNL isoform X3 [Chiloscyllium plagiosum]|uniref:lisH domain-containing protein FOPNL isoform X3 n=1 Tax=Chiloscyllium plagiosum TaxID=36176 RepID=UPI001CB7DD5D|nr:lisH domain-containing protein FOPNL isoform X3 [Chiloscyllium plagiosum]
MATVSELKGVLKETLAKRGVLGQLKARIRAEVFSALDDQSEPRPPLSHENLLINELIREYLEFNKYKYTASVLTAEAGQPEIPLDRQFLVNELNVIEDSSTKTVSRNASILLLEEKVRSAEIFLKKGLCPKRRFSCSLDAA